MTVFNFRLTSENIEELPLNQPHVTHASKTLHCLPADKIRLLRKRTIREASFTERFCHIQFR